MLSRFKIRTRLTLMATVPLVLIGLLMGSSFFLIKHLAVNGPAYERIATSKDFIAEVHEPKLYLIRAQMLMQQLARPEQHPGDRAGLRGEIDQVEIRYSDAFAAWESRVTDAKEKESLQDSKKAANDYFRLYRDQFRVLLESGKDAKAGAVLDGPMEIAYLRHQSAMENVAGVTAANIAAAEKRASDTTDGQMALLAICMIVLVALSAALGFSTVRSISSRIRKLSHVATVELPEVIDNVKRSTLSGDEVVAYRPIELGGHDELTEATHAFNTVLGTAVELASQQSKMRRSTSEMFVNLGRRNHKLLSRTLAYISELERDEADPDTLQKLFKLDHLSTRMRRHAESLLVLAGSAPLRTWSRPVPVGDVLRAALSEIEAYDRVDISSLEPMAVQGAVVSDLAHLMAELLENATTFSPPHTRIRILGRGDSEGYTLVVVDEGIGMTPQEMALANHHLAMAGADLTRLPGNSRMLGLGVVGRLAARHDLVVALADAPLGGTVARVTLPHVLLVPPKDEEGAADDPNAETALLTEAASVFSRTAPQANGPRTPSVVMSDLKSPERPGLEQVLRPGGHAAERSVHNGSPAAPVATVGLAAASPAIPIPGSSTVTSALPPASSPAIPAQPRSGVRAEVAHNRESSAVNALPGVGHSGQAPAAETLNQVAGHESVSIDPGAPASSVTVGTQPPTAGALPARKPANHSSEGSHSTPHQPSRAVTPQQNSERDSEVAPSMNEEPGAETLGGLRRRVRGENLPDTGSTEPVEPTTTRDAAGVRAALSSFKAGRDLANRDS